MSLADDVTKEQTSSRIDRLSLLPDELLHSIFDHAYSTTPPTAPLSKHLNPFFEQHFYRKVRLSSPQHVDLFLETISSHPVKGKLVKSLKLDRNKEEVMESLDVLESLFRLVPNLLELIIKAGIEKNSQSDKTFKLLSHLQMVLTELDDPLDLHDLAFLSALPNLTTLKIYKWPIISEDYFEEEEEASFTFPNVSTLCVEGDGGEDKSIQTLVKLCPNLLHLHLRTNFQEESAFDSALMDLPTSIVSSLQSLSLQATFRMVNPQDGLLLPFTQLRSLDLGDECFSDKIHSTLVNLPLLVKIRLGGGTIDPVGFLPLVSRPTRLVNLQQITFDFGPG